MEERLLGGPSKVAGAMRTELTGGLYQTLSSSKDYSAPYSKFWVNSKTLRVDSRMFFGQMLYR